MSVRMTWRDAVWESDLPPSVRLVALAYADHAPDDGTGVWITVERLRARTGLSRSTLLASVKTLRDEGWLAVVKRAAQHAAPVYDLIPQGSRSRTSDTSQGSDSRTSGDLGVRNPEPQGSESRTQPPTNPLPTTTTRERADVDPRVVVVVDRYAETYQTLRGLRPRRPLLDRVADVTLENLERGNPVEVLLTGIPEAVRRDEPWLDRYALGRPTSPSGPLRTGEGCQTHPGQPAATCAGCRADVLAGE